MKGFGINLGRSLAKWRAPVGPPDSEMELINQSINQALNRPPGPPPPHGPLIQGFTEQRGGLSSPAFVWSSPSGRVDLVRGPHRPPVFCPSSFPSLSLLPLVAPFGGRPHRRTGCYRTCQNREEGAAIPLCLRM